QFGNPDAQGNISNVLPGGFGQNGVIPNQPNAHLFANVTALGFALAMPTSAISFFQDKGKAKLLASTQVHVLDTEQQTIRIGKRVPIQTASLYSPYSGLNNTQNTNNTLPNGNNSQFLGGAFGGGGFPQIQYENVGLNIDMKPQVYEDEVQ